MPVLTSHPRLENHLTDDDIRVIVLGPGEFTALAPPSKMTFYSCTMEGAIYKARQHRKQMAQEAEAAERSQG